jgi:hypothetical protein
MTEEAKDELPEIAIRLGESDGFRRSQVFALSDALAQRTARSPCCARSSPSSNRSPTPETWQ